MRPVGGLLPFQHNELEFSATRSAIWVLMSAFTSYGHSPAKAGEPRAETGKPS